ncbi:mediator complex subunit [Ophidiomyces ophidiicola]|nr:mediator complex subunit [Ophidiomyces ophidiicola]KAI1970693.1 mediator complex subunit [Ophidiomyces ophidiicola]KAI2050500.1 mediator complex subunit [Ophidiomyces ophidiicola]KAI2066415.1 mediator complex subunit [Ophidiomyces ophidiicola]KAI2073545.1 mediator complex subunit [Ophidiomyces ophidiicola]
MPLYSDDSASVPEWTLLMKKCTSRRVLSSDFRDYSKIMMRRHPITAKSLVRILLDARLESNTIWEPLIPQYIDVLQRLGYLKLPEIMKFLLPYSTIHCDTHPAVKPENDGKGVKRKRKPSTLMTDNKIIQNIIAAISLSRAPKSTLEAVGIIRASADWISTLLSWDPYGDDPDGVNSGGLLGHQEGACLFGSLGLLVVALAATEKGIGALSSLSLKDRKLVGGALTSYSSLCAGYSLPLKSRLEGIQKGFNIYPHDGAKKSDEMIGDVGVALLQFESSVVHIPTISSRAGLYIYINSLLAGRPLFDDMMLLNYLNNRYGGDLVSLVEELITASFDVLSNGMYRNESSKTMFLLRAFLVNKLPPFLAYVVATMEPIDVERCITHALARVDPNTFPSFSATFSMPANSVLSDVRQEFLFSCALHKLIPESSIERLLGENPMQTLPVGGQFIKNDLIAQMNANPERAEQLLGGVEAMEGNAGAIVEAITEFMQSLCLRKETITLKNICNSLSRRSQVLDIMLLFKSPIAILGPLCSLLDAWKWEEDHGECQPVYDEFGSILLLVLAFKYKYNLTPLELGISSSNSFTLRLLEGGASSQRLEDLTDSQKQNLGAWITALYVAEGISDESMSSCSPQEFYLLVATLFSQSLAACQVGKLEFETLKGGFELGKDLLEPFLLPALVMALSWLGNHIWESESDLDTSLKILHGLVQPASISGEAQEIHRTVLSITSRALESTLKDISTRHPSRTDVKPIMDVLEPYQSFQRSGATQLPELDTWRANPAGGGLVTSIRNTFSSLVLWSSDPEISMAPPSYTHRQILAGIGHVGSYRVLQGLIDELKLQSETGSADLAFDIATTLICAPTAESFSAEQSLQRNINGNKYQYKYLTLRDALALLRESLPKLIESDPHRAELIVRLQRRVETLCSMSQLPPAGVDVGSIMENINLEAVGETAEPHDQQQQQQQQQPNESDAANIIAAGGDTTKNLEAMLDAAVGESAANEGIGQDLFATGVGNGETDPIDDVFGMMDMANPEFIDLDMEGMF